MPDHDPDNRIAARPLDPPVPSILMPIPIVWAFIGGSAAFLLGVRADLMLLAGGFVLIASVINRANFRRVLLWPA